MPLSSNDLPAEPLIRLEQAAGFVRRLAHDVRNALNALDLQLLLIEGDDEAVNEQISEARRTIVAEARRLGDLSNHFQTSSPQWIVYPAPDVFEDLRPRLERRFGSDLERLSWPQNIHPADLRIDFEMLAAVLSELVGNALNFADAKGAVSLEVEHRDGHLVFSLRNPRKSVTGDVAKWGHAPFTAEARAGYGLGLFSCRRTAEALGMKLDFSHDPTNAVLTSRLAIPIVEA